jgi:hypothetical protein
VLAGGSRKGAGVRNKIILWAGIIVLSAFVFILINIWRPVEIRATGSLFESQAGSKTASAKERRAAGDQPVLQGIILDESEPYCLIENEIYKIGEIWNGKTVTKISGEGVELLGAGGERSFLPNRTKKG